MSISSKYHKTMDNLNGRDNAHDRTQRSKLLRRVIAPVATVAVLAAGAGVAYELHKDAQERTVPAADEPHKYFHLGDTFDVNGKEVTIKNLEQAAELAGVGDSHNVTEMLRKQIPAGETERTLGGTETFDLPLDAQIGTTYIPE